MTPIPLHKPFLKGNEKKYVNQVLSDGKLSGNGIFTKKCHDFFQKRYGFSKVLLTNSCTDALEMCVLILGLNPGDEILVPSYTFVTTAGAFTNYGIKPVFCDSGQENPNISFEEIKSKTTKNTKAIIVMHYGGIACEMESIQSFARENKIWLIEDAALGLDAKHNDNWLGSFGDVSTFSFHETKNITCGEGGLLVINRPEWHEKAEIIWEKGTNRSAFLRGESEKYEWVSKGASFITSEIHAAVLLAQLENLEEIQIQRKKIWDTYYSELIEIKGIQLPSIPRNSQHNASLFFFLVENKDLVGSFIRFMRDEGVTVASHYRCLHKSEWAKKCFRTEKLINCEKIEDRLIRLPLFPNLKSNEQKKVVFQIKKFFQTNI